MAAKKTVADKNTVSAIALSDLNIVWGDTVVCCDADTVVELPHGLYDYLSGLGKIASITSDNAPVVLTEEPIVEAEPVVEEAE